VLEMILVRLPNQDKPKQGRMGGYSVLITYYGHLSITTYR
jgi:hypothetical protein